jgi:hypothetical protein
MKRNRSRSPGAYRNVERELSADGVKQRSILGIETGGSTAIGRVWPSASSRRSHKKVPAWRNGIARVSLPAGGRGERVMSGSAAVKPSSPCQFSTVRTGRLFWMVISSSSHSQTVGAGLAASSVAPTSGFQVGLDLVRSWRLWLPA